MKNKTILFIFFLFVKTISCLIKEKDCNCRILPESKIIFSKQAHHLAYPWIVSLSPNEDKIPKHLRKFVSYEKKTESHFCSGVIVNENWILTAAHCTPPLKTIKMYVGFGNDNDLKKIFDFGRIESMKIIQHVYFKFESKKKMIFMISHLLN